MRRDHLEFLKNWRKDPIRVPLLIRGARQVGKSASEPIWKRIFILYRDNFESDRQQHNPKN